MFERNRGEKKRRCDRALPPNERKLRAKQLSPPVVRIISHCFPVNTLAAKRADNRGFREFFRDPAHAPPSVDSKLGENAPSHRIPNLYRLDSSFFSNRFFPRREKEVLLSVLG